MATTPTVDETAALTPREIELAKSSVAWLAAHAQGELRVRAEGSDETIAVPAPAVRALLKVLANMAEGKPVAVLAHDAELTTQQAADLLGVSRPFLIERLEKGEIPYRLVGTHRRVLASDVIRYKRDVDRRRLDTLAELAAQAQELGMGY